MNRAPDSWSWATPGGPTRPAYSCKLAAGGQHRRDGLPHHDRARRYEFQAYRGGVRHDPPAVEAGPPDGDSRPIQGNQNILDAGLLGVLIIDFGLLLVVPFPPCRLILLTRGHAFPPWPPVSLRIPPPSCFRGACTTSRDCPLRVLLFDDLLERERGSWGCPRASRWYCRVPPRPSVLDSTIRYSPKHRPIIFWERLFPTSASARSPSRQTLPRAVMLPWASSKSSLTPTSFLPYSFHHTLQNAAHWAASSSERFRFFSALARNPGTPATSSMPPTVWAHVSKLPMVWLPGCCPRAIQAWTNTRAA